MPGWRVPPIRASPEIATKSRKEAAYHLRRSSGLIVRLGDGTADSHARMQAAAESLWPFTGEFFTADFVDTAMAASGAGFEPASLRDDWLDYVRQVFDRATLRLPPDTWMHKGGKQGVHTEHLSYLLAEMQVLHREYPGATW